MGAARRRRRWFATNFGHLGPLVRPRYRRSRAGLSVSESIARERQQAAAEAARRKKGKR